MMQKKYQVFISSTFQDLIDVRRQVSEALLRAECFPAGMELFPAADEEQFEFIKKIIIDSDYYVIISAGRYGSIEKNSGLSFTELEYDFAVSIGKPIIRLLHIDPFNKLVGEHIEKSDEGKKKLEDFRSKMKNGKLVRFWETPEALKAEVVFGIMEARNSKPAIGWVKADRISSEQSATELAELRLEIAKLELLLERNDPININIDKIVSEFTEFINFDIRIMPKSYNPYGFQKNVEADKIKSKRIKKSEFYSVILSAMFKETIENRILMRAESKIADIVKSKDENERYVYVNTNLQNDMMEVIHHANMLGLVESSIKHDELDNPYNLWNLTNDSKRWVSKYINNFSN